MDPKGYATVRSATIDEIAEVSRNDLPLRKKSNNVKTLFYAGSQTFVNRACTP